MHEGLARGGVTGNSPEFGCRSTSGPIVYIVTGLPLFHFFFFALVEANKDVIGNFGPVIRKVERKEGTEVYFF